MEPGRAFPDPTHLRAICAGATILFLQLTNVGRESFSFLFTRISYFVSVVAVVSNVVVFAGEEFQRKLRERNQQWEQTVEKGTIALMQQEEELQRGAEIQHMLLPSRLPQLAGVQIAGAWQPAREVGGDYFDVIQLDKDRFGICVDDVAGNLLHHPARRAR